MEYITIETVMSAGTKRTEPIVGFEKCEGDDGRIEALESIAVYAIS